ncbi:MAG: hypothetical protein ACKV2U_30330 [Bryobacteraceae bacterium]
MRAVCESCAKPQPVDWRPGDLCVHCGVAVREEARCFWCAKWGPKAKFCRKCGAGAVAQEHYGPARMLKHMGASVFEIPKLLKELDPELIATHQSIYGAHAAVANRHIEDARWLGRHLYQRHWDAELEEELIAQLPWPDERLEAYSVASKSEPDPVTLSESSPFPRIRDLAHLVRIHRGDFRDLSDCTQLIHSADPAIAAEAALQFSGWRAIYCTYTEINRHDLIAVLRESPLPAHAAPRLAVLGAEPRPEYFVTGDPDTDFLVLILDKNTRALETFLGSPDPMRRYVSAAQLVRLQHAGAIGPALRGADPERQLQLLRDVIRYKNPIPALHNDFFALIENSSDVRVRQAAAQAISLARFHPDSLRLLDLANGDSGIIHSLLRSKPAPESYLEIGRRLVRTGHFNMDQWGWDQAAKPDAMPVTFVEENYPHANHDTRRELLRFAEKQIEAHGVLRSPLERLLIRQCFASAPAELIGTAWACVHRIQMHREAGLTVPCDLSLENVSWCWTLPEVLTAIADLMANREAADQTFVRDDFDRFLRSAEPEFFAAAKAYPDECRRVIESAPLADPYTYAVRFAADLQGYGPLTMKK